jgi:hypoxanthine phosphoribosyltransferase
VTEQELTADLDGIAATEDEIAAALDRMASEIRRDYPDPSTLLLVGVLKGAVVVVADLIRRLPPRVEMDWMAVSSYGAGTRSSGVVRILKDLDADLHGKHVLVVEDIVDSGRTLAWLLGNLRSRGALSVEVAALFRKPDAAVVNVPLKYVGIDIPNDFVVGFGLDYAERYRGLPYLAVLSPRAYSDDQE